MKGASSAAIDAVPLPARPRERALADLWQNAHALSEGLVTEDGRRFRVVYPGRRSARAGPDFRDSVIETDTGDLLTGDVELHLNAPDWRHHRHHVDPNYNGVILHVVLHPRGSKLSEQQSKTAVPVASLEPVVDMLTRVDGVTAGDGAWDRLLRERSLAELLDGAADQRFRGRSKGFVLDMDASDAEEVLYRALLEGLGYSSNRKPFRELALRVPMAMLRRLGGEPGATRLIAIKAMLIRAAGLLPFVESADEARQLRAVARRLPKSKAVSSGMWQLFRVRPANHPVRRVAGAAHVLDRYVESGLVHGLEGEVRKGKARLLVQALAARPFIGDGRAKEIAVNVVLPFMYAWAGVRRDPELSRRCLELYRGFPSLEDNEITREMKRLLSTRGQAVDLRSARRQQGLIQLYRTVTAHVPT